MLHAVVEAVRPYELKARDPESGDVRVVIDTPAGSRNKYKLDESTGLFRVSRILPRGMAFPHDFGSVPGTCAEDGDPLDVLVLGMAPSFPGCLVNVRLIGVLRAAQTERGKSIRNDRLIGCASTPVNRPAITELKSLDPQHLHEIEEFFYAYNHAQGRPFRVTGRGGARAAEAMLKRAERSYSSTHTQP